MKGEEGVRKTRRGGKEREGVEGREVDQEMAGEAE
jgi:hypothetical protein